MDCGSFEIEACVEEGNLTVITYNLTDENGDPITSVDLLEYKLTDGKNTLIAWTGVVTPDLPAGEIKIPGGNNRISSLSDRFFTLHANYNASVDDSFKTVRYGLRDSPNTTTTSPT